MKYMCVMMDRALNLVASIRLGRIPIPYLTTYLYQGDTYGVIR